MRDVAHLAEVGTHQVNVALRDGTLSALRSIGSEVVIDDLAAQAWNRSRSKGRRWTPQVRRAAFDLINDGTTSHLAGSELSRLRRVLRTATARHLAHLCGGIGGPCVRYRALSEMTHLTKIGPSTLFDGEIGVVGSTSHVTFAETSNLDEFEATHLVSVTGSGSFFLVERKPEEGRARVLIDTYLLGGSRESHEAAWLLESASHGI